MSNPVASVRALLIYVVCLPLAIFLGYLLAGPMDPTSLGVFGGLVFLLILPLLFRYYHFWLIVSWNLCLTLYGLPGAPPAWFLMAFIGFFIGLGHHILNRNRKYVQARSVTWSLIFIALVVIATAQLTGGIGMRLFGTSTYGGKRYLNIAMAILGYFALISQPVPPDKRKFYVVLFLLSGATSVIGELFPLVSPSLHFFFLFFPPDFQGYLSLQGDENIARLGGLATASNAIIYTMLAYYGVAKTLSLRKPWRPILFVTCFAVSTLGGFRSLLFTIALIFAVVFYLEGLMRSRLLPFIIASAILAGMLCVPFADRLPLNVQRTLSFLPLNVSPVARMSAENSSTWRFEIWQRVIPEVPKYLVLGKGLSISGQDLEQATTLGNSLNPAESVELSGDYHSGPLSLIIPFGIFGAIGFLWFLVASFAVLRANYFHGDEDCKKLNRFLLALFAVKVCVFFFIFGSFYGDLAQFVGIIGLSLSVNGGVAKKSPSSVPTQPADYRTRFPLFRRPEGSGAKG